MSPIDVGLYDMGYSDGSTGYNLPTLSFTWGTGPTLKLSNNNSIGLYVPARAIESAWDLSNAYTQVSGLAWNQSSLKLFESDVKSAYDYVVSNSPFNGSAVVPGVYLMMESWSNSSPGFILAGLSGAGIEACPIDLLETCLVSNISLSANAGSVFFPPEIIGVSTNLSGTIYSYAGFLTSSEVWWGPIPVQYGLGIVQCGTFGLCGLSPYHVVKAMLATCITTSLFGCVIGNVLSSDTYEVSYDLTWNGLPWTTVGYIQLIVQ